MPLGVIKPHEAIPVCFPVTAGPHRELLQAPTALRPLRSPLALPSSCPLALAVPAAPQQAPIARGSGMDSAAAPGGAASSASAATAGVPPLQAAAQGCARGMFTGLVLGIVWGVWEEKKFVFRNCVKVRARFEAPWGWSTLCGAPPLVHPPAPRRSTHVPPLQPYHLRECPTRLFAVMQRSVTTAPVVATFVGARGVRASTGTHAILLAML